MAKREFWAKAIITAVSIFLIIFFSFTPVDNSDYGFHLRTGQDIIKNHVFPLAESYSYTAKGAFNPAYSWIFDCLSYIFYVIGNINGLIYLQAMLIAVVFLFVLIKIFSSTIFRHNLLLSLFAAANVLMAFAFLLQPRIMIRPQLLGFVMLAVFVFIMERIVYSERSTGGIKDLLKDKYMLTAMAVFLFWVNSHSTFVEAYALFAIWIVSATIKNYSQSSKKTNIGSMLIAGAILFVLTFFTPNFNRIFATFVSTTKTTEEFYSLFELLPKFGAFYVGVILAYDAIIAAAIIYYFRVRDYYRSLTLLFFMALSLYSVRFLGELGIVAGIMSVPAVTALLGRLETKNGLKKAMIAVFALLACAQGYLIYYFQKPMGLGMDRTKFPIGAVEYLKKTDLDGNMFNSFGWGGYLIWELQKYPVFIDGRVQVYTNDFLDKCSRMLTRPPLYFYELCDKYRISFGIVPYATHFGNIKGDDFSGYLFERKDWALVYFDNYALVYIKRGFSPKNDAIILKDEYKMLYPTVMAPPFLDEHINNKKDRPELVAELQRAIAQSPDCIYPHFCLAYYWYKTGDFDNALKELEVTRKLYPTQQIEALYEKLKSQQAR